MERTRRLASPVALALLVLALATACGSSTPSSPSSPSGPSTPTRGSHNAGRDCLECHNFTVAGTVYQASGAPATGVTVRVTSGPGGAGSLLLTLTSDGSGNFYTTDRVNFGSGVYTDAKGTGELRSMQAAITSGRCNSCHTSGSHDVID